MRKPLQGGCQMSTATNKALIRRWAEEVVTQGILAVIDELFAADFIDYTNPPDWLVGHEGHRRIMKLYHEAFLGFHYRIEHEVAEGDFAVVRGTYHGTPVGEFFGIPPTGKQ